MDEMPTVDNISPRDTIELNSEVKQNLISTISQYESLVSTIKLKDDPMRTAYLGVIDSLK